MSSVYNVKPGGAASGRSRRRRMILLYHKIRTGLGFTFIALFKSYADFSGGGNLRTQTGFKLKFMADHVVRNDAASGKGFKVKVMTVTHSA